MAAGHGVQHRTYGKMAGKTLKSARKVKASSRITKLRKNITPGTVLICLGGRFRGRRVVFLKQLESGLLLVTGPYKVNGVPLKRVNQRFVISTSTKIKVDGIGADIKDDFFARSDKTAKSKKNKGGEGKFFKAEEEKETISEVRKAAQKKVDPALEKALTPELKAYLKARFSLSGRHYPHEMKF